VRRSTLLLSAACALLLLSGALGGVRLLRAIPWFDVQRVEVSGTRLLAPHEVLARSGIRTGQSVWDDPASWEASLREHPVIAAARVTRRLPHTLRIRVEEKRPVAYLETGSLQPATGAGEVLPVDPTRAPVDIPIVRGEAGAPADSPGVRRLLAETERLGRLDPVLLAEVSEIRAGDAAADVLVLSHRRAEIVLPAGVGSVRLLQLRAVLDDLERRAPAGSADARAAFVPRVDLRFGDQIVVRLPSSV
jgi:cell division protein FtsQ